MAYISIQETILPYLTPEDLLFLFLSLFSPEDPASPWLDIKVGICGPEGFLPGMVNIPPEIWQPNLSGREGLNFEVCDTETDCRIYSNSKTLLKLVHYKTH